MFRDNKTQTLNFFLEIKIHFSEMMKARRLESFLFPIVNQLTQSLSLLYRNKMFSRLFMLKRNGTGCLNYTTNTSWIFYF